MRFNWAKSYMPRSLYGRAALILLVPVVTLQLVVSVVFIQRHYAGVTEQMARNVALELRYFLQIVDGADTVSGANAALARIAEPLAFQLSLPSDAPGTDSRRWFDFSGRAMMETLRQELPGTLRFDLSQDKQARVWLQTVHGQMAASFDRGRVSASNPHQLLVLMVFTGILMTLIAFIFLRNQLRPIKRLADASEAFGKGRIEAYRPSGALEVRAAGNAFLDMRARIDRQMEQRTMMLSGVSHDLRTPLTRLKLGLSMQEETDEIEALQRDVGDMELLLDEFLAFARDDSLDDLAEIDPQDLISGIVAKFARSGQDVELGEISGQGLAKLRPLAVARALDNLIGNAVRYGTKARVSLAISERALRFTIEDDGPGIAEDRRADALKPFVRLDAARNQDRGSGVGLGLAIAHDIARRHGGSLGLGESALLGGLKADLVLAR